MPRLAALALLLALLSGCARDFLNERLVGYTTNAEALPVAPHEPADPDEPYIVISFSGGGVRATALAYAVLRELDKVVDRRGRPLTEDIRIVSSASGGSVTAAWFGLYGRERLAELRARFITVDNMAPMELAALNPVTWVRLAGSSFSRVDVLREYLDDRLFHRATFANLYARPGAPITILNATDMSTGEVFSFTHNSFDDLCSNLATFPLAGAVAASAAFPILLTPVSLKNWTTDECRVKPLPTWADMAIKGRVTRFHNLPTYKAALELERTRNRTVLYKHLLDGGLADNLGSSAILAELFDPQASTHQLEQLNRGRIRTLVAIEVNARADSPNPIDTEPATPGLVGVVGSVVGNPIDAATRGHAAVFEDTVDRLKQIGRERPVGGREPPIPDRIYGITVDFDQFDSRDPAQVALRDRVKQVPTSWTMTPIALEDVEAAARRLLEQHPCFVRLREDLAGQAPSSLGRLCDAEAGGTATR